MFKSKEELGGKVDDRIYRGGRSFIREKKAKRTKPRTYEDLGREELLKIYRRIKPLSKDAIKTIHNILLKDDASEAAKLRAAAFVIQEYKNLALAAYDSNEIIEEDDDIPQTDAAPVFHLRVIDGGDKSDKPTKEAPKVKSETKTEQPDESTE